MIEAGQRWAAEHGRQPRADEWIRSGPWWPAQSTVAKRFGSWVLFLEACGFESAFHHWTREEIAEAMVAWRDQHGRWPTHDDWKRHRPSSHVTRARFRTWPRAIREADRYRRTLGRNKGTVDLARLKRYLEEWTSVSDRTATDLANAAGLTDTAVHKIMGGRNGTQTRVTLDVADRLLVAIGRPDLLDEVAA